MTKHPLIHLAKTVALAVSVSVVAANVSAADITTHGLSSFGDLKYPEGFTHFEYVNPSAPKGGDIRIRNLNTFDSLNPFILKGVAEIINGDIGGDLSFNFASLMTRAHDEPDTVYALVAKTATLDADKEWVEFTLREGPTFHDGSTIRPEDLVFTFNKLKNEGRPQFRTELQDVEKAEVTAPNTVRYTFREDANVRGLPARIAVLPILSERSFEGKEFDKTTLTPLLGSGPYKITDVQPGRSVTYERIKGHWAENLPVHVGRYNFDKITVDYYRDRTIALEAFFAGEYDFREEFTSRNWAEGYTDKPAIKAGLIKKEVLPDERLTGFQAFFFNTRRPPFDDIRVRRALARLFDFEWTNKNLFYDSYERLSSFFENSEMKATGTPSAAELELLEPWRNELPKTVFNTAFVPEKTDGSGNIRKQIRQSLTELKEAGWTVKDKKLVNNSGEQLKIEFLIYDNGFNRIINPFIRNMERIGVDAKLRLIDVASWQNRLQEFDFDIVTRRFGQPAYPGIELKNWWGSASANIIGSLNAAGAQNPAIDDMIQRIIDAETKDELVVAARALDRIIMASHYTIPQWFKASHFVAYWDRFGNPAGPKPGYSRGMLHSWWIDKEKQAALDAARNR